MARSKLHIGEIAAQTGVSVDAVRYYEKRHLLPRAPRTEGGFRIFTSETIERVRFIKEAQGIGLSLDTKYFQARKCGRQTVTNSSAANEKTVASR